MAIEMHAAPTLCGKHVVLRALCEADRAVVESDRNADFRRLVGINAQDVEAVATHEFEQLLADPLCWAVTIANRCIGTAFLHSLVRSDKGLVTLSAFSSRVIGVGDWVPKPRASFLTTHFAG